MQYKIHKPALSRAVLFSSFLGALSACGPSMETASSPGQVEELPLRGETEKVIHSQQRDSARDDHHQRVPTLDVIPETSPVLYVERDGPDAISGAVRSAATTSPEIRVADQLIESSVANSSGAPSHEIGGANINSILAIAAATGLDGAPPRRQASSQSLISDEQDFAAVSDRESIESDAARLERQRSARLDFLPEEIPQSPGFSSVADFAFNTTNQVGTKAYSRFGSFFAQHSLAQRCAEFGNNYAAQQAFLDAGGPMTDKLRLDPDGDGFACGWTPDIYRNMIN